MRRGVLLQNGVEARRPAPRDRLGGGPLGDQAEEAGKPVYEVRQEGQIARHGDPQQAEAGVVLQVGEEPN